MTSASFAMKQHDFAMFTATPFHQERKKIHRHIKTTLRNRPILDNCGNIDCLNRAMSEGRDNVGFLGKDLCQEYLRKTSEKSDYEKLLSKGYVILDENVSSISPSMHIAGIRRATKKTKHFVPLRHSVVAGDPRTCDGRLWMHIFPDDMDPSSLGALRSLHQCSAIIPDIATVVAPREQFAMLARDTLNRKLGIVLRLPPHRVKTDCDLSNYWSTHTPQSPIYLKNVQIFVRGQV